MHNSCNMPSARLWSAGGRTRQTRTLQPRPRSNHDLHSTTRNTLQRRATSPKHGGFRTSDASGSSIAQRHSDSGDVDVDEGQQPEIVEDSSREAIAKCDGDGDDTREAAPAEENWLRRVASDGRSHVAQLERELEVELAQTEKAAEAIQIPEPRHVKYATVMAKNLRRSSLRTNSPRWDGRHTTDAHMTPEERRELTRAQREVMWNLQREGVITIVRPGDDPVPYKRQGNPKVNTPQCVRQRQALRKKTLIQVVVYIIHAFMSLLLCKGLDMEKAGTDRVEARAILFFCACCEIVGEHERNCEEYFEQSLTDTIWEISSEYWCFPGLNPESSVEMSKASYLQLNRKLHLALIPGTTDEEARRCAEVDWLRDTSRWKGRMSKEAFFSSMFELADIWTENIDEEEYTAFLWLLLETITDTSVVPPSFKRDQDIECIVDKDLAEVAGLVRTAFADDRGRRKMPLPIDIDAVTAALAANRSGGSDGGSTLSPRLKDKHVQRLRALRQRLQALKQLRTGTRLAADAGEPDGKSVAGDGVASAEEPGAKNGYIDVRSSEEVEAPPSPDVNGERSTNSSGDGYAGNEGGPKSEAVEFSPRDSVCDDGDGTVRDSGVGSGGKRYVAGSSEDAVGVLTRPAYTAPSDVGMLHRNQERGRQKGGQIGNVKSSAEEALRMGDGEYARQNYQRAAIDDASCKPGGEDEVTLAVRSVDSSGLSKDHRLAARAPAENIQGMHSKYGKFESLDKEWLGISNESLKPAIPDTGGIATAGMASPRDIRGKIDAFTASERTESLGDNTLSPPRTPLARQNRDTLKQASSDGNVDGIRSLENVGRDVTLVRLGDGNGRTTPRIANRVLPSADDKNANTSETTRLPMSTSHESRIPVELADVDVLTVRTKDIDIESCRANSGGDSVDRDRSGGRGDYSDGGHEDKPAAGKQVASSNAVPRKSHVVPRHAEGDNRHDDGTVGRTDGIERAEGGKDSDESISMAGNSRERRGSGVADCSSNGSVDNGAGRAENQGKDRERKATLDMTHPCGVLAVGSGKMEDDAFSAVESSVSGDWMAELTEDEEDKRELVRSRGQKGHPTESLQRVERARQRVEAEGEANGVGSDAVNGAPAHRQQRKLSVGGLARESKGRKSSTRRSDSKEKGNEGSYFRPAGGNGGWDGITGTTNEQWALMIEQAKEERREAFSRSQARRAASRERATARDSTAGRRSSQSSSPAAAQSTRAPLETRKPDPHGSQTRGDDTTSSVQAKEDGPVSGRKGSEGTARGHDGAVQSRSRRKVDPGSKSTRSVRHGGRHRESEDVDDQREEEETQRAPSAITITRPGEPGANALRQGGDRANRRGSATGERTGIVRDAAFVERKTPPGFPAIDPASSGNRVRMRPEIEITRDNGDETTGGRGAAREGRVENDRIDDVNGDVGENFEQRQRSVDGSLLSGLAGFGDAEGSIDSPAENRQPNKNDGGVVLRPTALRVPTNAIDRRQEVLVEHNMTMADLLQGASPSSTELELAEVLSEEKEDSLIDADHIPARQSKVREHHALSVTGGGHSSRQGATDSVVSEMSGAVSSSTATGRGYDQNYPEPVSSHVMQPDRLETRDSLTAAGAADSRDICGNVKIGAILGDGRVLWDSESSRLAETDHPGQGTGDGISGGGPVSDGSAGRDGELCQGGSSPATTGMLFSGSTSGVVGGTTNKLASIARGSTRQEGRYTRGEGHWNRTEERTFPGARPLSARTSDKSTGHDVDAESEARHITQPDAGKPGAYGRDSAAGITSWGTLAFTDAEPSEMIGRGGTRIRHEGSDRKHVELYGTLTIRSRTTGRDGVVEPHVRESGIQPSAAAAASNGGHIDVEERRVYSGDFIARTETSTSGRNPCKNGPSGAGREGDLAFPRPLVQVEHDDGAMSAHDGRNAIVTDEASAQLYRRDRGLPARPADYDRTEKEDVKYRGKAPAGVIHRETPSALGAGISLARPRTRSGCRSGRMVCGPAHIRGDDGEQTNSTADKTSDAQGTEAVMVSWTEGQRQLDQQPTAEILGTPSSTTLRTGPAYDSSGPAAPENGGGKTQTDATALAAGSILNRDRRAEGRDEHAGINDVTIHKLQPHPPGCDTSNIRRVLDSESSLAEYRAHENFGTLVGPKKFTMLLAGALHPDSDGIEMLADRSSADNEENKGEGQHNSFRKEAKANSKSKEKAQNNDQKDRRHEGPGGQMFSADLSPDGSTTTRVMMLDNVHKRSDWGGDKILHNQGGAERNVDGSNSGLLEAHLPIPESMCSPFPCKMGESVTTILTGRRCGDRLTNVNEQRTEVPVGGVVRAQDDHLAEALAFQIATTSRARYNDVLTEVTQALDGAEDSAITILKEATAPSKTAIRSKTTTTCGSSMVEEDRRNRLPIAVCQDDCSAKKPHDGGRVIAAEPTTRASETFQEPGRKDGSRQVVLPTQLRSSLTRTGEQYTSKASTLYGARNLPSTLQSIHDTPRRGGANVATEPRSIVGATDKQRPRSRTAHARLPLPHHVRPMTVDGGQQSSRELLPRNIASEVMHNRRRGPPDHDLTTGLGVVETTRYGAARRQTEGDSSSRKRWRTGNLEGTSKRVSPDDESILRSRQDPYNENRENGSYRDARGELVGARGSKIMVRDRWKYDVHHAARPLTADNSNPSRDNGGMGRGGNYDNSYGDRRHRKSREAYKTPNDQQLSEGRRHDNIDRTGDRYFIPPPPRIKRPRTALVNSARQDGDNDPRSESRRRLRDFSTEGRDNRQRRPRMLTLTMTAGGTVTSGASSDNSSLDTHRDREKIFPAGKRQCEQSEDERPMLWRLSVPQSSYFGWREPHTAISRVQDGDKGPQPYYVETKQMRHHVPSLDLPPWRTPAPGEPGWEPILNYCDVKRDEEEVIKERKLRDHLVRRRRESGRDGGGGYEVTSSVSGDSNGSHSLTLSSRHRHYASRASSESVRLEGDDNDGDYSVAGTALARRVNAEQQKGPATTTVTSELEHVLDIGSSDKSGPLVIGKGRNLTESGDVSPTSAEGTNADAGALHRTILLGEVTRRGLRGGESVTSVNRRFSFSLSPQRVSRPRENTGSSLKSYDESYDASGLSAGRVPGGSEKSQVLRSSISDAADISPSHRGGRGGNSDDFLPPTTSLSAEYVDDGGCSSLTAQQVLSDDYTDDLLAASSSISSTARRPSTSGSVVLGYHGSLRPLVGPATPTITEGTNDLVLQAAQLPRGAFTSTVAVERGTETKAVPRKCDARPRSSWQRNGRQRSSLAQATSSAAVLVDVGEHSLVSSENTARSSGRREIFRRSSLPVTALAESLEHRRRSDLLLQRIAAVTAVEPSRSRRSFTSVPGSQWAQDTLLRHVEGRSRLAPATRTAGGRWGSNHGRLESLLREGGTAVATSSAALAKREIRGTGQWVFDAEPGLPGSPQDEVQYPLFQ